MRTPRFPAAGDLREPVGPAVHAARDLEAIVSQTLAEAGIEPSSLCLEITESVLLEEPEGVADTIRRVAALGARFVLDDFGTGYSSLAYLQELPIDGLKVDQSFVKSLGCDRRSTAITTAIVRMAQALSMEVIAEGVKLGRQLTCSARWLRARPRVSSFTAAPGDAVSELLRVEHAAGTSHAGTRARAD